MGSITQLLASSRAGFLHFWLSIDALCHFSHFTNGHIPGVLTLRPGGNGTGPGVEFIRTGTAPQSLRLAARVQITARNRYSRLVSILMAVGLRFRSRLFFRLSNYGSLDKGLALLIFFALSLCMLACLYRRVHNTVILIQFWRELCTIP